MFDTNVYGELLFDSDRANLRSYHLTHKLRGKKTVTIQTLHEFKRWSP